MNTDARERHEPAGKPGYGMVITPGEMQACASLGHLLAAKGRSIGSLSPFEIDDALDTLMALFERL